MTENLPELLPLCRPGKGGNAPLSQGERRDSGAIEAASGTLPTPAA